MKYIISNSSITFFFGNRPRTVKSGTPQYARALEVFDLPESEQDEAIKEVFKGNTNERKAMETEGFEFFGSEIKVDGEFLPKVLADWITRLKKDGLPITLFLPFWRRLKLNPDYRTVNERGFYDFLAQKELALTEDGCFIGYRGVREDYWSQSGNTRTEVLQGQTDSYGRILNSVGSTIEVKRNGVSTDKKVACAAHSLHVGSLKYAQGWGNRVVIVKVDPKDVVSVAECSSWQKLRVCKFEVIGDFEKEIEVAATDKRGKAISTPSLVKMDLFAERIDNYLRKKQQKNKVGVSIQKIRNSFSPEYPDKKRVLATVTALGWFWTKVDGHEYVTF
jgi:hypothetical protein|tara:strand:- start:359 stop:1360 length:1002 start_codon:yes stop_codon:yes gene_type:complete